MKWMKPMVRPMRLSSTMQCVSGCAAHVDGKCDYGPEVKSGTPVCTPTGMGATGAQCGSGYTPTSGQCTAGPDAAIGCNDGTKVGKGPLACWDGPGEG